MTDAEFKEQMQAAQDLVDSLSEQRNNLSNAMAQINAMRRAEQRQMQELKAQLQAAVAKVAELEERLSKMAPAIPAAANGAETHALQ